MGLPINESFLLTAFGPITVILEIDPDRRDIAYTPSRKPEDREEGLEGNDSPMGSAEIMICKFLGMRDERNALHKSVSTSKPRTRC